MSYKLLLIIYYKYPIAENITSINNIKIKLKQIICSNLFVFPFVIFCNLFCINGCIFSNTITPMTPQNIEYNKLTLP